MHRSRAEYGLGQVIHHRLFNYRGVIIDVDPFFARSNEWYTVMAKSKPAKEQPWYHVLVDDTDYMTYVAEQNLEVDPSNCPINHPELAKYFHGCKGGLYKTKRICN